MWVVTYNPNIKYLGTAGAPPPDLDRSLMGRTSCTGSQVTHTHLPVSTFARKYYELLTCGTIGTYSTSSGVRHP